MATVKPSIPKGTRDFLSLEATCRNYIFATLKQIFARYAYQPIATPSMENLSTLMGKYRYSIKDVHERTGLSRTTISSLYNDKASRIDYTTIEKLCALFNCGIETLLLLETEKHGFQIQREE